MNKTQMTIGVFIVVIAGVFITPYMAKVEEPQGPLKLNMIKAWTGSSDKTTSLFYVPTNQVRISWAASKTGSYSQLLIIITNTKETYYEYWAIENDLRGETYAYLPPGNYYLEIKTINMKYAIAVESVTR